MRYPAFVAEMASEANRPKLELGVRSGYGVAGAFFLLVLIANVQGIVPYHHAYYVLIAAKLATNAALWLALRINRGALEIGGLNIVMDLVVMTAGIYLTGGLLSPLMPIYVIEITVIALLTNLGITLVVAGLAVAMYTLTGIAVHAGWLPEQPPPVAWTAGVTTGYLVIGILYFVFVLGIPTFFTASILRTLKDREGALRERTEELVDAAKQRSQFMANITHELRTPLQAVIGISEMMNEELYGPITDRQKHAMLDLERNARSLLQLIDDLLELARSDAGKLELRRSEFQLEELLTGVLSTVRSMKGRMTLEITSQIDPDLPVMTSDRPKLAQIVLNLLANAVKFTPEGGRIMLRAARLDGERVRIDVEDTGIGIPEHELTRVFEEFRQVDGSKSRKFGGAGLGLALVKRLVELLGGDISVRSKPQLGSTFSVTLPVRVPAPDGKAQ